MLVIEKVNALVMNLNNPARVMASIPTAQPLTVGGKQVTVVPHEHDEVRVLRNLGIMAPAPILHYYNWPGHFTPYEHQRMTAAFLTMNRRGLVLNDIGTGKTNSALWAIDYLKKSIGMGKVLIVSPLSTLERVWGDTIFTEFPNLSSVTLYGTAQRRLKLLQQDVDLYIINHNGFGIISDNIVGMFDLILIDEAAVYRNPSSNLFKIMYKWLTSNPDVRVWLMTGTPTPNAPTDAWALSRLIKNVFVTQTFTAFRDQTMIKVNGTNLIPRINSTATVFSILRPAVRYKRDDCVDLPPTVVQVRQAKLSAEQSKLYKIMMNDLLIDAAAHKAGTENITAVNAAVKIQKLVQISCGVAYDDQKNEVHINCKPRVDLLKEIISEAGEKIIVFVPLTGTLHMIERELSRQWTVSVVNGAVTPKKRNKIFSDFQTEDDPHILLAHPATMAHGLTLTAASTIIWYGPITSNEQYVQANGRIERIGKRYVSNVVQIVATPLEEKMYKRLESKQKLQDLLLDLIEEGTDKPS